MAVEPLRSLLPAADRRAWAATLHAACENTIDRLVDLDDPNHRQLLTDVTDFRNRLRVELDQRG